MTRNERVKAARGPRPAGVEEEHVKHVEFDGVKTGGSKMAV